MTQILKPTDAMIEAGVAAWRDPGGMCDCREAVAEIYIAMESAGSASPEAWSDYEGGWHDCDEAHVASGHSSVPFGQSTRHSDPDEAAQIETYRQMHETVNELGYPSILEALEDLERIKASSDELREALDWLGNNTRMSLEHYSPVYCEDDDQSEEWRVTEQRGNINDREYVTAGRGETPLFALQDAITALSRNVGDVG